MSSFNSLAETRKLGGPVVRLFRVALGRDPDPMELQRYASRLRQGAALQDLATDMMRSVEFTRLMGCDSNADPVFVARIAANALPEGATREAARVALQTAAELGMNQADLVGMLSDSPHARDNIPLFPGLAPGASPDDTTAYRLWVEEYDSPVEADLHKIPPAAGPRIIISMAVGDITVEGLLRSLKSFQRQTYGNWELVLTHRVRSAWPSEALTAAALEEPRLHLLSAPEGPASHADWQQAALARCSGEFVCFLNAGDTLPPTALQEVVAAFAAHPGVSADLY